jgi:two-component system chemotaxis response regulator CheY
MSEVLYVEDSTTSQILMRRFLEGIATVTVASSLEAALQSLRETRFDLMIADYNFPEGNSLQLIQYVRSAPMHHKMPVIVVSSSMDAPMLTRILKIGANDGLAKPLKTAEIRAMATRMLAAPYVRHLDKPIVDVSCFQWRSSEGIHQFCPELNLIITGPTAEDVIDRMRAALKQHGADGGKIGNLAEERVVRLMVDF